MMNSRHLDNAHAFFVGASYFLFWGPIISSFFGWYDLATYLFVGFFLSFGMALILSAVRHMAKNPSDSKLKRLFLWMTILSGLFLGVVGFGILEFEPIFFLLLSLPLIRLLSSRSLTDILKDEPGRVHPWMDRLSDALFILSAILFVLLFFTEVTDRSIGLVFSLLGMSLCLDQIHFALNHPAKRAQSYGLTLLSALLFLAPGVWLLIWA